MTTTTGRTRTNNYGNIMVERQRTESLTTAKISPSERGRMLEIGYMTIDRVGDLSFDPSEPNQELTDANVEQILTEKCSICQEEMIPERESDYVVQGETCNHCLLHASCFLENVHQKYLLPPIGENYCHILVPAIICPLCQQFGGWRIKGTGQLIPDSVQPFAYH
jgi:hypothetical protein